MAVRERAVRLVFEHMIDACRDEYGVEPICRALQVAPSTHYAVKARQRDPSERTLRNRELLDRNRRVHEESFGVYGVRKVWWQLSVKESRPPAARWDA